MVDSKVTDEIHYLSAIEEGRYVIAQANAELDDEGRLIDELVTCRERAKPFWPCRTACSTWTWPRADGVGGGFADSVPGAR